MSELPTGTASLWPKLARLPLRIEAYELERMVRGEWEGEESITTQIRLLGSGADGLGEDIGPFTAVHDALRAAGPTLPLAGEWTLEAFCDHLGTLEHWPQPPEWEPSRLYRNWAYESAALDLALRQAGRALHDVLGLEPRPVRFVNSLGLGDPPSMDALRGRRERYPGLRFKLDADPGWTPDLIAELAATGAVDTIDFKGRYELPVEDADALAVMYERVVEAFPDVLLEDPHEDPEIAALLAPHAGRLSYDAPIHGVEDLAALPVAARTINVKPSRIGSLRGLLDLYAHCAAHGVAMYGGGMGETAVARGQVQLLASLFHPDAPNDVAPGGYNEPEPPEGLPSSPLPPRPVPAGFRREPDPVR